MVEKITEYQICPEKLTDGFVFAQQMFYECCVYSVYFATHDKFH